MSVMLDIRGQQERPTAGGYYLVWRSGSERPFVAFWSEERRHFVDCTRILTVKAWAGPLPERREPML